MFFLSQASHQHIVNITDNMWDTLHQKCHRVTCFPWIAGKFIPNLSTMIHPLNALLGQGRKWNWTQECANAFKVAKQSLTSDSVLVHYDPQLPLCLVGDASCHGIGAVLSHQYPDGLERPICLRIKDIVTK